MGFENGWLARVVLRAETTGQEVVNTLHYNTESVSIFDPASIQELADRLRDDLMVPYRNFFPPAWTIDPIVVTQEIDPQNPTAPREQRAAGPGGVGTRASPTVDSAIPSAMCSVVTEITEFVGRSFRGRMFMPPGFDESQVQAGNWDGVGTYITAVNAFLAAIPLEPDLVFGPAEDTTNLTVFSRTRRAADLDPYAPDVIGFSVNEQIRWLRSREAGN